jgi:Endonuclease/Exonuclease/phosphatase family.
MPTIKGVVIGGDFNTNHDQAMFTAERTLDSLADAGYQNGFEGLPLSERVTHPESHGFPDATFDFIFAKGLTASQPTVARTNASDHWPVTRLTVIGKAFFDLGHAPKDQSARRNHLPGYAA